MSENPWAARTPEPGPRERLLAIIADLDTQGCEDALSALEEFGIGTVGSA